MGTKDKVFRRTRRLMDEQGLDLDTAMKQAIKEVGVVIYDKEPEPGDPGFQGIKPMSIDELLAHRQRSQPKIGKK